MILIIVSINNPIPNDVVMIALNRYVGSSDDDENKSRADR